MTGAVLTVRSPGRVNLIGEHTDYNDGFVLPMAIDPGTDVTARPRADGLVRARTRREVGPGWERYVDGCAAVLRERLGGLPGADLLLDGDLPLGAGLSSSASLEVGVLLALARLAGADLAPAELARLGQRVEHEAVGVRSGIMDQLAVACGVAGHALLIDCRSLVVEAVPVPGSVRVLVLDSAVPRTLAGSAYNDRRADCEAAAAALGVRALRDLDPDAVAAGRAWSGGELLTARQARRVRYVVGENARVLAAAEALRAGDVGAVGRLMSASHAGLRDDYEVSVAELDTLVEIAEATPGVLGARLTGAGFGGCAVALVRTEAADAAAESVAAAYRRATGRPGSAMVCRAAGGAAVRAW